MDVDVVVVVVVEANASSESSDESHVVVSPSISGMSVFPSS